MKQPYQIKVMMEASFADSDTPYQQTVFIQNYDTHGQQVEEQLMLFPQVVDVVKAAMVKAGRDFQEKHLTVKPKPAAKKAKPKPKPKGQPVRIKR